MKKSMNAGLKNFLAKKGMKGGQSSSFGKMNAKTKITKHGSVASFRGSAKKTMAKNVMKGKLKGK